MSHPRAESQSNQQSVTLLVVSDEEIVRDGFSVLLNRHVDIDLRGVCRSEEVLAVVSRDRPDVILLDCDGLALDHERMIRDFITRCRGSHVLAWAARADSDLVHQVYRAGALGLALKSYPLEQLWRAILTVSGGQVWMDKNFVRLIVEAAQESRTPPTTMLDGERAKAASLTRRELEIIRAIGKGYRNKQIADSLCISDTTVRHHLSTIFGKLQVSDRLELLLYAQRHGLLETHQ
jgi:DNA-binding NarL/FixJ family response regulator